MSDNAIEQTIAKEAREDRMTLTSNDQLLAETPVPPMESTEDNALSTEIEPLRMNDDDIILQGCPPASHIFCDTMSIITDILSFEGAEDEVSDMPSIVRVNQASPRSAVDHQACPQSSSKACLTPRSDQACQRRGRFLVWPASLASPALTQTE